MSLPSTTHPGLPLGPTTAYTSGHGTHIHASHIHASLAGTLTTTPPTNSTTSLPTLSIHTPSTQPTPTFRPIPSRLITSTNILPAVDDVVLARVTRVQPKQVSVAIVVVGETVCADGFQGVVRREDVRGWEVEGVVCAEGFRVGDVVRGVVISLGDQSSYYLSTARNELGVIMAKSEEGNQMYPVSWKEFRDPVTGRAERRKVAKPF